MFTYSYCACLFVVIFLIDHSLALSSQCYACHGEYCNDPFNKDRSTVMTCSNSANFVKRGIEEPSGNLASSDDFKLQEKWDALETKLTNLFSSLFGTTEYVCAKSLYYNSLHLANMTLRSCMPKNFKGMDTCTYLSNIISGYGKVRTCSFCDSDLCNSAINLKTSALTIMIVAILKIII